MSNTVFKTPKETELPILTLKGKPYLQVAHRLVWFREEKPDWSIETDLISVTDKSAYCRAIIKNELGRIMATAHKFENVQGFGDFIEKAETGSIGRALAMVGYGTQFCADEFEEGDRLADAPVEPAKSKNVTPQRPRAAGIDAPGVESPAQKTPPASVSIEKIQINGQDALHIRSTKPRPGDYVVTVGRKFKDMKLSQIPTNEMQAYIDWLEENASKKGQHLSKDAQELKDAFKKYESYRELTGENLTPEQEAHVERMINEDRMSGAVPYTQDDAMVDRGDRPVPPRAGR